MKATITAVPDTKNTDVMSKDRSCIHRTWIGWIKICRKINDFIENMFEKHTRFITSHHSKVIIACFVFTALMAIGAVWFNALQRNEELFIPQGSQAFKDLDRAQAKGFEDMYYRNQDIIISGFDNMFDKPEAFKEALKLHKRINASNGYEDVCFKAKNEQGIEECLVVTSLQVFGYNESMIGDTPANIKTSLNQWLQNPNRLFSNGRPAFLNYPNIFGTYKSNDTDSSVISANAIRITYYTKYVNTWDSDYDTVIDWEKDYFIDICKSFGTSLDHAGSSLKVNYFAGRTTADAILESTVGDLPLFSVAFILMVAFCLLVFSRWKNLVTGHLTVAICGICVIMLGVGCGFGLAMWIRTDFVAFTGILLFLILGIGMDNMFIIVDAMESADPDIQGEERLVVAMKHIGGSITMTTSTDLVAFAVSAVSDFPAVKLFCIYAALSIVFAYLMLITLFLALLTWDVHRIERGGRDICPCRAPIEQGEDVNPWLKEKEDFTKIFMRKWGEILMTMPMKIIVCFVACGTLAAGIYGTTQITQKFEWKKTAPDGSYFRQYAAVRDDNFPAGYGVSIILPYSGDDFGEVEIQDKIISLNDIAKNLTRYQDPPNIINWMDQYRKWGIQASQNTTGDYFYQTLPMFLNAQKMFAPDIIFDSTTGKIKAARIVMFYVNDNDATNQATAMQDLRDELDKLTPLKNGEKDKSKEIYAATIMFIYAEQFAAVVDATILNLAICGATIVVITIPYLMHPGITGLVFLSFSSLLFELLGLMTAWDVSLDVIAMIIIIMAVGFSVDYTCHIAHAYMISRKDTPNKRAIDALTTMGTSVLNGGVSTFLGMLITAFSQAEGFRIFFKMVFGIVVLGLIHGLIFLPVLLTIFVRRDLREDMEEFIKKHDEEERSKSKRRMSHMSETQKRRQSMKYRQSTLKNIHVPTQNGDNPNDVKADLAYVPETGKENGVDWHTHKDTAENGVNNNAFNNKDELVVTYTVQNE
ncbi:patched domain-containing protein 3-like isoform X3 [Clytia hemisphaerica]|uniref:SSD domain-containing protein n=1 Tax=Clytia hemisphaerica TaxID=252671 RepID=A0A7M5TWJ0_9CNID